MVNAHFVAPFLSGAPFTPSPALLGYALLPSSFAPLPHYLPWSGHPLLTTQCSPCTRLSRKGYAMPFVAPFFAGRELKSGSGQGLLAKTRNGKDIRNMARSKK